MIFQFTVEYYEVTTGYCETFTTSEIYVWEDADDVMDAANMAWHNWYYNGRGEIFQSVPVLGVTYETISR